MRSKSDGSCVRSVSRERYVGGSVMRGGGVSRADSVWGIWFGVVSAYGVLGIPAMQSARHSTVEVARAEARYLCAPVGFRFGRADRVITKPAPLDARPEQWDKIGRLDAK